MEEAPPPIVSNHTLRGIIQSLATSQDRLLRLELVVVLSALILAAVVLHGSVHGSSSDNVLRGAMGIAYSMLPVAVSYAVGLIQDGPFHDETFALWATALLLIQASAMSTSERKALLIQSAPAIERGRCEQDCVGGQRKKLVLQHVLQTGLVLWLIITARSRNACYRVVIWVFWALNLLKTAAKIVDVIKAGPTDMSVKVTAEYMAVEDDFTSDQPPSPITMQGYKYIFHGEETMLPVIHDGGRPAVGEMLAQITGKHVVTIDQVYNWIDRQTYNEVEKVKARDFCLAFTLFKLLKRRFYGYVPAEVGSRKARDLMITGLIHDGATGPDAALRVVEEELHFLYDFLYTTNSVQAMVGENVYICMAVTVASVTICLIFIGTLAPHYHRLLVGVHDLDRSITVFLVVITAGLEVCQAVASFPSRWRYVKTVYRCVRDGREWSRRWRGKYLWWRESVTQPEIRYWEQKVGQYELLKRFRHRPCNLLSWMTLYLVEPQREGQKRGRRKSLPNEVRRGVLLTLKQSNCHLTNGVATLQKHRLLPHLAWACRLPKVTDHILAWHIVTTCCDWASGRPDRGVASSDEHRLVARKLSNYCAYLVAFVPEMLPDPSYNTQQIFDTAVQQARDHLDGCRTQRSILARMEQIADAECPYLQEGGTYGRAGGATVIERAAVLWGQLRSSGDDARLWQVLAEFWMELVLFLAPSDNVEIHGRMLSSGSEFLTLLWALLSHAGVLERPAAV